MATAGRAIPIKLSLSGDQGMDIFAAAPFSQQISCVTGIPQDGTTQAVFLAANYDPLEDQYIFVWQTDSTWKGTCRQFKFQLIDGTIRVAYINFRK